MYNKRADSCWYTIEQEQRDVLAVLFADSPKSFLIDAVLQGHMGEAVADRRTRPHVALLSIADVVVFGGDPAHPRADDLAGLVPPERGILLTSEAWYDVIERVHGDCIVAIRRYGFDDTSLDLGVLRVLAGNVPNGYSLERMDLALATEISSGPPNILPNHVRQFDSPEDFTDRGIGFCMLHEGKIAAAASSYAVCDEGIEVQIDTRLAHRQRGLGTVASAALVAHVIESGLRAHWDAANHVSARLATILGYTPTGVYWARARIADPPVPDEPAR